MKVILLKDVKGQGKKHDIIDVKDGYGNNFLIKNGLGVLATEDSVKRLKSDVKFEQDQEQKRLEEAQALKKELEKVTLEFKVKVGTSGRIFGQISTSQIAEALHQKKYNVDKKKIFIDVPIQSLGYHKVKIELHKNVVVELKIATVKES